MIKENSYRSGLKLLLSSLLLITSCEIINPSEEIPSYLHISGFDVQTAIGQGTASYKISDVWVYVDDQLIGAYELPATVPVLAKGSQKIHLRPGIQLNGISATRAIYPMYNSIVLTANLEPGKILNIDSISDRILTYHPDVLFPWNARGQEDFEDGGISIDSTGNSQTRIIRSSDVVFEGNYSGKIELNSTVTTFEGKSTNAFVLPLQGNYTFIELNYKCNNSFHIGYYVNTKDGFSILRKMIEIFPKENWNKIYINLTPYVSIETNPEDFNIWIGATKNPGVENPEIYLDNIKLLHY